jgi:uncharacterized membrane protein YhfC
MVAMEVLVGLAFAAVIALAAPFVAFFALRRRMDLSLRNVLVGVAIFIVFVLVREAPMHAYLLQFNPTTKAWFAAHPLEMAIYAALAAGLFEETGRYLGLRYLAKHVPGNGTPVAYGIGHGGAECALIAVNLVAIVGIGYLMTIGKLDGLGLPKEAVDQIRTSLAGTTAATSLVPAVERICGLVLQIGFSFLIWQAIRARSFVWYLLAVAAHAAVDMPAALFQQKLLPLTVLEIEAIYVTLAFLALAAMWAFTRPREA